MQSVNIGQSNTLTYDCIDANGDNVTTGTLAMYLYATQGDNAGKWWDGSAWSAVEASAGNATYIAQAQWSISIGSDPFELGAEFTLTGVHSVSNIQYSEEIVTAYDASAFSDMTALTDVRRAVGIDSSDDTHDAELQILIAEALKTSETFLMRKLLTQTCYDYMETFPTTIRPTWSALLTVTSITYVDTAGNTQTLSSDEYQVVTSDLPGTIQPAYGYSWPANRVVPESIKVTYTAGYGSEWTNIPANVRNGIKMMVAHRFCNKESGIPADAYGMMYSERVLWL